MPASKINKILSGRLYAWGQDRAGSVPGLSLPNQSTLAAMQDLAPSSTRRARQSKQNPMVLKLPKRIRQKPQPPNYFPTREILEVQGAIDSLKMNQQQALFCRYIDGTGLCETESAFICNTSPRGYWDILSRAHKNIARRLNIKHQQ